MVESAEARDLAESVYSTLADELESLSGQLHNTGINLDLEVWTPNQTGDILGNSREERAKSAEKRASDINADLIVYGQLVSGKIGTNFIPEFYLSEQKLRDAEELVGQYEFGTTIKGADLITRNVVTRSELRDRLLGRTRALAQFVIGLSLYTLNRFDAATTYFLASEATEGWDEEDGKEVLYHFLGNTALRLNHLQVAEGYYQHALQLEPEYARSQLGIAEINFHRSRADCQPDTVDAEGVHLAITGYQQALMAAVQPALSDIHTKAAFAVGRAYLCLSQAEIENHWSEAEQQFLAVIVDYEEGNPRVRELAADAYAHLGLIYLPEVDEVDTENKYQRAADAFVNALELTHYPERQATYNLWLGWIYAHSGDCTAAAAALAQADKSLTELANNRDNPDPVYHEFRLQVGQAVSTCNSVSHADPPD